MHLRAAGGAGVGLGEVLGEAEVAEVGLAVFDEDVGGFDVLVFDFEFVGVGEGVDEAAEPGVDLFGQGSLVVVLGAEAEELAEVVVGDWEHEDAVGGVFAEVEEDGGDVEVAELLQVCMV